MDESQNIERRIKEKEGYVTFLETRRDKKLSNPKHVSDGPLKGSKGRPSTDIIIRVYEKELHNNASGLTIYSRILNALIKDGYRVGYLEIASVIRHRKV